MARKKGFRVRFWATLRSFLRRIGAHAYSVLAVSLAFLICGILILLQGVNPLFAYYHLFLGAFGSVKGIAETLVKTIPLLLVSLGVAFSFRSEFVNIGAEGQFFMGALFTSLIALTLGETSAMVVIPLMLIAGFIGGGLWALIPGVFKVRFKANEAIVTMLMNSIAFLLVSYLVHGPIREKGYDYPQTAPFSPSSHLPRLMPGMRIHAGFFIPFVCAVIVYLLLNKTIFGYRIRAVHAEKAAEYGGINVAKNIIYGTVLGGGLAGLAGFCEVAGLFHRLRLDVSPGYGYMAIAVAFLGNLHPLWIIPSSFLFAALIEGADQMRRVTGVPIPIVTILQGLTMIFVLVGAYLSRRRR